MLILLLVIACGGTEPKDPVYWRPVNPPTEGLRCWWGNLTGEEGSVFGAVYCERIEPPICEVDQKS